jgi:hypothetical protein
MYSLRFCRGAEPVDVLSGIAVSCHVRGDVVASKSLVVSEVLVVDGAAAVCVQVAVKHDRSHCEPLRDGSKVNVTVGLEPLADLGVVDEPLEDSTSWPAFPEQRR